MNINVIYHHFPHYRAPILRELVKNGTYNYRFFGSHKDISGIKAFRGDEIVQVQPLQFDLIGRIWWLRGYMKAVTDRSASAIIVLGNSNMPASWFIAVVGRMLGKKVLFWAHGWLKPEPFVKRWLRNLYFSLPNKVLVYGERAVVVAREAGFDTTRVRVIYNSLDYDRAVEALQMIEAGELAKVPAPQEYFADNSLPLLICTARLTELCRFDLLIEAAAKLKEMGKPVNIMLVGDGPVRISLAEQAARLGVNVHFFGACYDEEILATLMYHSDLTVSPGKIGLTVIHSLTYGTPAVTHGDLDHQMPEVEAIQDGVTGMLFERNNSDDLANKIYSWLDRGVLRDGIRRSCRSVIDEKWNPSSQRQHIEAALDELLDG